MMTLIHILMFGFLVGTGLCAAHFTLRRLAEKHDVACPWGRLVNTTGHAVRLAAMGGGAYVLASVGWVAVPAALGGFLLTRPALAPVRVTDG